MTALPFDSTGSALNYYSLSWLILPSPLLTVLFEFSTASSLDEEMAMALCAAILAARL